MSSMELDASAAGRLWSLPHLVLSRAAEMTLAVIDVLDEVQREAEKARRRYPFTVW